MVMPVSWRGSPVVQYGIESIAYDDSTPLGDSRNLLELAPKSNARMKVSLLLCARQKQIMVLPMACISLIYSLSRNTESDIIPSNEKEKETLGASSLEQCRNGQ